MDVVQKCKFPVCRDGAMGRLVNGLIFGADVRRRGQWQKVVPKHRGQVQFTTSINIQIQLLGILEMLVFSKHVNLAPKLRNFSVVCGRKQGMNHDDLGNVNVEGICVSTIHKNL